MTKSEKIDCDKCRKNNKKHIKNNKKTIKKQQKTLKKHQKTLLFATFFDAKSSAVIIVNRSKIRLRNRSKFGDICPILCKVEWNEDNRLSF